MFMKKVLAISKGSNTSGKYPRRLFYVVYNFYMFHKLHYVSTYKTVDVNYFLIMVSEG